MYTLPEFTYNVTQAPPLVWHNYAKWIWFMYQPTNFELTRNITLNCLASFPGSCAGEEVKEPDTLCVRMRQVPTVTCILLHYTKIFTCWKAALQSYIACETPLKQYRLDGNCHSIYVEWTDAWIVPVIQKLMPFASSSSSPQIENGQWQTLLHGRSWHVSWRLA